MRFAKSDLVDLKWSLGAFALSLLVSVAAVLYSDDLLERSRTSLQAAQNQLNAARSELESAQNDQLNMATYAIEYNALVRQKIIGNEQRLDWMEGLESLRSQGHVLDFRYTISPQQAYTPSPALDAGSFQLNRSPMTLDIDLLHEEQLLQLLTNMRKQLKGWFILDGCTLTPPEAGNGIIKASCSGGWFTMKSPNTP